jgi:hypothetical protein
MKKDKKMENSEILDVFNKEVRRECEWTRMRRESFPHLVRYTLTDVGNGGGMISWSDLTAETADETIKTQIAYFKELNTDFEWKYYSYDQPSDLPQRLLAHGFTADEPEALMIADINDLPSEWMCQPFYLLQNLKRWMRLSVWKVKFGKMIFPVLQRG